MKQKMTRVTVSLPVALVEAADKQLADEDESRSALVRRLLESALREAEERDDINRWVRSYRENPQAKDDLAWVAEISTEQLEKSPWE
jgi:Predicted transcriptional regulators containing the CopG/Arc/MetJ DNA-binding domain and a metal-binding domain